MWTDMFNMGSLAKIRVTDRIQMYHLNKSPDQCNKGTKATRIWRAHFTELKYVKE